MWDHVVQPGETLTLIAQKFKKNLNEIFRLNPQIRDKSKIWAGNIVHMPDPAPQGDAIIGPITVTSDPQGLASTFHDNVTYFVKPGWSSSFAGATLAPDNRLWSQELDLGGTAPAGLKGWQNTILGFSHQNIASISTFPDQANDLLGIDLVGVRAGQTDLIAYRDGKPVASLQIVVRNTPSSNAIYVDDFISGFYDIDYRAEGGNYSKYLILRYVDDVVLTIQMDRVSEVRIDAGMAQKQMHEAKLGDGGKRFPAQLNASTTPNLVKLKRNAIDQMNINTYDIIRASKEAVIFVLMMVDVARHMLAEAFVKMSRSDAPVSVKRVLEPAGEGGASALRKQATEMVSDLRASGKPVVVNLAGTGEVPDAINVNTLADQQTRNVPRLLRSRAEDVVAF